MAETTLAAKFSSDEKLVADLGTDFAMPMLADVDGTPSAGMGRFTTLLELIAGGTFDFAAGTLTADGPLTLTQTWNEGSTTFTAFKVDVTDTASAADSKLMDLQVDGSTVFVTQADGFVGIREPSPQSVLHIKGTDTANQYFLRAENIKGGFSGIYIDYTVSGEVRLYGLKGNRVSSDFSNCGGHVHLAGGSLRLESTDGAFAFETDSNAAGASRSVMRLSAGDTQKLLIGWQSDDTEVFTVEYDGGAYFAGDVGLNMTDPTAALSIDDADAIHTYNLNTDASNYERVEHRWQSNVYEIASVAAGTGTLRGIMLGISGNSVGFLGATPVAQQTTGVSEATFVENSGGTAVNVDSTFGGYTIQQMAQALQNYGLLA